MDEAALDLLAELGYSLAFGARFLKRAIDERVKLPISEQWKQGDRFQILANGNEIQVHVTLQDGRMAELQNGLKEGRPNDAHSRAS